MKEYQCIYKYAKGPQSTETDDTGSHSDTERQHGQTARKCFKKAGEKI